jgi:hypothetical protein
MEPNPNDLMTELRKRRDVVETERCFNYLTAWHQAGYILFALSYTYWLGSSSDGHGAGSQLPIYVIFATSAVGNLYALWGGYRADTSGPRDGIKIMFLLGLGSAIALFASTLVQGTQHISLTSGPMACLAIAALLQSLSGQYISTALRPWFNTKLKGSGALAGLDRDQTDKVLDLYHARQRLIMNVSWLIFGLLLLAWRPDTPMELRMLAVAIFCTFAAGLFYPCEAATENPALESPGPPSEKLSEVQGQQSAAGTTAPANGDSPVSGPASTAAPADGGSAGSGPVGTSGKTPSKKPTFLGALAAAFNLLRKDPPALASSSLFVLSYFLGLLIMFFWQDFYSPHPEKIPGDIAPAEVQKWEEGWKSFFHFYFPIVWFVMSYGRILGSQIATYDPKREVPLQASLVANVAPRVSTRRKKWKWGIILNGVVSLFMGLTLLFCPMHGAGFYVFLCLMALFLFLNRIGQEILFPMCLSSINSIKEIQGKRATVEALVTCATTLGVPIVLGCMYLTKSFDGDGVDVKVVLGYSLAGFGALLPLVRWIEKRLEKKVAEAPKTEAKTVDQGATAE